MCFTGLTTDRQVERQDSELYVSNLTGLKHAPIPGKTLFPGVPGTVRLGEMSPGLSGPSEEVQCHQGVGIILCAGSLMEQGKEGGFLLSGAGRSPSPAPPYWSSGISGLGVLVLTPPAAWYSGLQI